MADNILKFNDGKSKQVIFSSIPNWPFVIFVFVIRTSQDFSYLMAILTFQKEISSLSVIKSYDKYIQNSLTKFTFSLTMTWRQDSF